MRDTSTFTCIMQCQLSIFDVGVHPAAYGQEEQPCCRNMHGRLMGFSEEGLVLSNISLVCCSCLCCSNTVWVCACAHKLVSQLPKRLCPFPESVWPSTFHVSWRLILSLLTWRRFGSAKEYNTDMIQSLPPPPHGTAARGPQSLKGADKSSCRVATLRHLLLHCISCHILFYLALYTVVTVKILRGKECSAFLASFFLCTLCRSKAELSVNSCKRPIFRWPLISLNERTCK